MYTCLAHMFVHSQTSGALCMYSHGHTCAHTFSSCTISSCTNTLRLTHSHTHKFTLTHPLERSHTVRVPLLRDGVRPSTHCALRPAGRDFPSSPGTLRPLPHSRNPQAQSSWRKHRKLVPESAPFQASESVFRAGLDPALNLTFREALQMWRGVGGSTARETPDSAPEPRSIQSARRVSPRNKSKQT